MNTGAPAKVNVTTPETSDDKLAVTVTDVKLKEQREEIIAILIGFVIKGAPSHKIAKLNFDIELADSRGRKAKGQRIVVIAETEPLPTSAVVEVRVPSEFQNITDGTSKTFTLVLSAV